MATRKECRQSVTAPARNFSMETIGAYTVRVGYWEAERRIRQASPALSSMGLARIWSSPLDWANGSEIARSSRSICQGWARARPQNSRTDHG